MIVEISLHLDLNEFVSIFIYQQMLLNHYLYLHIWIYMKLYSSWYHPEEELLFVQATSRSELAIRKQNVIDKESARLWLGCWRLAEQKSRTFSKYIAVSPSIILREKEMFQHLSLVRSNQLIKPVLKDK